MTSSPRMPRLPALATAAALSALPAWAQQPADSATPPAQAPRPNILVILSDDQGYADAGFQGCKDIPTPNLDRLAAGGIRCTSGYVSHPVCSPSRAGLLTGRHQARFGHERNPRYNSDDGLPLTERLLPEFLAPAGYATGWIGKWHLGSDPAHRPSSRGFQETFGFFGGGHDYLNWKPDPNSEYSAPICRNGTPVDITEHLTLALGHEAAGFIRRHKDGPWFLYLAFNAPHTPDQPTAERLAKFAPIKDPMRRAYAAQVGLMDDAVGYALDALRESGQEGRTLVFFLSDNGGRTTDNDGKSIWHGADNGPLRAGKGHMYEGGVRVPFLVSWTGKLPAGRTYDKAVSSLDIFPTALACAGVPMPDDKPCDGVNLVPYLTGENKGAPHDRLFWRREEWGLAGMRSGDLKLVRDRRRMDQVFDLHADPGEKQDLAAGHSTAMDELENAVDTWMRAMSTKLAFLGEGPEQEPWPERNSPAAERSAAEAHRPRPAAPQLAWQEAELGVIFHYDPRIFAEKTAQSLQQTAIADPKAFARKFNPDNLDTDQWAATARAMGARFAILVVKHETGFCLWQSDANPYSLKMLDWRGGKGDILRDFVESCRKYGLKAGVFTEARWDTNLRVSNFKVTPRSPVTQAEFNRRIEREVEELCTRYGELIEIWFDGGVATPAQGGPDVLPIVAQHQPGALFYHSDQRRDARWGGTETGTVGYPCWATVAPKTVATGRADRDARQMSMHGDPEGSAWCPAMSDSPLRCEKGRHHWFWAADGEAGLASLQTLQDMYYKSVGRNSTLILGLTPDRSGRLPEADAARCREFGGWIEKTFGGRPLAETSGTGVELALELPADAREPFTHIILQEDIRDGERVREYAIEAELGGAWQPIGGGTCIGHKRIETLAPCAARKVRLRITRSDGVPNNRSFSVR